MAEVTTTRVLPPVELEAASKTFLNQLSTAAGKYGAADLSKVFGQDFVAQMDPLQLEAMKQATAGIGSYEPFLQAAQAATGPQAYKDYMSPYQQEVIDTTLQEYDLQAQKGLGSIAQQAIGAGAFGGAREGVAQAEYMTGSDRNRAALQAQLLGQGFGQAQQAAAQQYGQQMGLATGQQGLLGRQISGLSTLGAGAQAQKQADLSAEQQLAQQQLQQPLTAAQAYGSGITGLIAGYPGQTTQTTAPSAPTPGGMQTALSTASTLAGIYGALR
jgi:hypothetical protein